MIVALSDWELAREHQAEILREARRHHRAQQARHPRSQGKASLPTLAGTLLAHLGTWLKGGQAHPASQAACCTAAS